MYKENNCDKKQSHVFYFTQSLKPRLSEKRKCKIRTLRKQATTSILVDGKNGRPVHKDTTSYYRGDRRV